MSITTPIINIKPINPTQEQFMTYQKFGLQPYDRSPNDYLRFVAQVFTAWRDPKDKILNFDPFDAKYGAESGTTDILQATSDKSIVAYIDGFQTVYDFVRITTDEETTNTTIADNVIVDPSTGTTVTSNTSTIMNLSTVVDENGNVLTIDKAKFGEYHKFSISAGICFIDDQLVQITEDIDWWFRVPKIIDYTVAGKPVFEAGEFIINPAKVYCLLPEKNYNIILSYEFINQFEINSSRLQFVTSETAIDQPYLLIGTFTTDEYGMVHQTFPVNEDSIEQYKNYVIKREYVRTDEIQPVLKQNFGNMNFYYGGKITLAIEGIDSAESGDIMFGSKAELLTKLTALNAIDTASFGTGAEINTLIIYGKNKGITESLNITYIEGFAGAGAGVPTSTATNAVPVNAKQVGSIDIYRNAYYLKDINPQYLDKKYMANHKNLFKHLQSQLITTLADSKIANTFHCKIIDPEKEEIDLSVSSGDMVYYHALENRWYPAEVSRQDFDKVQGLYLKNLSEGTHLVFTSGIIEIDERYQIMDSSNRVLRNLIPGAEYFLAEDTGTALDTAPFIDAFKIEDFRYFGEALDPNGYLKITSAIIATCKSVDITFRESPLSGFTPFKVTRSFVLDPEVGRQRIQQSISWEFTPDEMALVPKITNSTGQVLTDMISFDIVLHMKKSEIEEKNEEVIENFKISSTDIELEYTPPSGAPVNVIVDDARLFTLTNGISDVIFKPLGPIMNLLDAYGTKATKLYNGYSNIQIGQKFQNSGQSFKLEDIKTDLIEINNDLNDILYDTSPANLGLNDVLKLLSDSKTKTQDTIDSLDVLNKYVEEEYKAARLEFQATDSAFQAALAPLREDYLLAKSLSENLASAKFIAEQKRYAVDTEISHIDTIILHLAQAQAASTSSNIAIQDRINNVTAEKVLVDGEIVTLNSEIATLKTEINGDLTITPNVNGLYQQIIAKFLSVQSQQTNAFDYRSKQYNLLTISSIALDYDNINLIMQRLLYTAQELFLSITNREKNQIDLETKRSKYLSDLKDYTDNILNGSFTYAQQLIAAQTVAASYEDYTLYYSKDQTYESEILYRQSVITKLEPDFLNAIARPKAELFAEVIPNTDPNSIWGTANETIFTVKMDRALTYDISFRFYHKEDTLAETILIIPAGDTSASTSMYLHAFPDSIVDAGIPKWKAYKGTTEVDIFNINKFNQQLVTSAEKDNPSSITIKDEVQLFTFDKVAFVNNPNTVAKRLQPTSKLRTITELNSLLADTKIILDSIALRETKKAEKILKEETLALKTKSSAYKQSIIDALTTQKAGGVATVDEFQDEIDMYAALRNEYTTSPDPIDVLGSDMSRATVIALINAINTNITAAGTDEAAKKALYDAKLLELKEATDKALKHFITMKAENIKVMNENKDKLTQIQNMFTIYSERTNLLISINTNIEAIINSGIFNGTWTYTDPTKLNNFEIVDAMENSLVEIINWAEKIPGASVRNANILKYSCTTNGFQYPMDLQPWVFMYSKGKISTRRYPGATSIGTALNHNTLILNIQHRPCGDISEFLNVYGNEDDFQSQLMAKYYTTKNTEDKTNMLLAKFTLTNKIEAMDLRLSQAGKAEKTRKINGIDTKITTILNDNELNALENLVQGVTLNVDNTATEAEKGVNRKELLLRLTYLKFFGNGKSYNPMDYLFNYENSKSSFFEPTGVGNPNANMSLDKFNPELKKTLIDYTSELMAGYGTEVTQETFKTLFYENISLYKELDIVNYILTLLPEPLINYIAMEASLTESYKNIIEKQLTIKRYQNLSDPNDPTVDFMDVAKKDALIKTVDGLEADLINNEINHDSIVARISKYDLYRRYFLSLKNSIENAIDYVSNQRLLHINMKDTFVSQIAKLSNDYDSYFTKMNKLPNPMWDIFRVTNGQRTKWNYTYLVLRIMGMQKELNNIISGSQIQYSPINSQINEWKLQRKRLIDLGDTAAAANISDMLKALELKKANFSALLQNMVDEFNVIQLRYGKRTITAENTLTEAILIDSLYMRNANEYNIGYAFAPYPAYKEIV